MVACTATPTKQQFAQPTQPTQPSHMVSETPLLSSHEKAVKLVGFSAKDDMVKNGPSLAKKRKAEEKDKKTRTVSEKTGQGRRHSDTKNKQVESDYIDENSLLPLSQNAESRDGVNRDESANQNTTERSTEDGTRGMAKPKLRRGSSSVNAVDDILVKKKNTKKHLTDDNVPRGSLVSASSANDKGKTATRLRSTRRTRRMVKKSGDSSRKTGDSDMSRQMSSAFLMSEKRRTKTKPTQKSKKSQHRAKGAPRGGGTVFGDMEEIKLQRENTSNVSQGSKSGEDIVTEKDQLGIFVFMPSRPVSPVRGSVENSEGVTAVEPPTKDEEPNGESGCQSDTVVWSKKTINKASTFSQIQSTSAPPGGVMGEADPIICVGGLTKHGTDETQHGTNSENEMSNGKCGKHSNLETETFYPRISCKLTFQDLREEALCRGLQEWQLPRDKDDLLTLLGEGSIYLGKTAAWREVERIRGVIVNEEHRLKDRVMVKRSEGDNESQREDGPLGSVTGREIMLSGKTTGEQLKRRSALKLAELEMNQVHHVHLYPSVHDHPLALTGTMLKDRQPRSRLATCNDCASAWAECQYSCEMCDFDLCKTCFGYRRKAAFRRDEYSRNQFE